MSHSQFGQPPESTSDGNPTLVEVDARGLRCPMPLLRAKQALNKLLPGESLWVKATDPGSERDFFSFAQLCGHQITYFAKSNEEFHYVLRKHSEQQV